jgi:hypothetical protein
MLIALEVVDVLQMLSDIVAQIQASDAHGGVPSWARGVCRPGIDRTDNVSAVQDSHSVCATGLHGACRSPAPSSAAMLVALDVIDILGLLANIITQIESGETHG